MQRELLAKISEMLVFGFPDAVLTENSSAFKWISNQLIGGLIFFDKDVNGNPGRNIIEPSQITDLLAVIKSISRSPLFLAVDQEGGKVARLNSTNGFVEFPSHALLGKKNDLDSTRFVASEIAELLSSIGFNVNFAPVVDLSLNLFNPVIAKKERSFGDDPEIVFKHAKVFIEEHRKRNILCVGKHFPGHGSARSDTHFGWVDSTNHWLEIELRPYEMLISSGNLDAIMTAHIFNGSVDWKFPATLSKVWISEILRNRLEFSGIVFSDDLQMKAIADNFSLEESVFNAISAGIDVLLFANMQNSVFIEPEEIISIIVDLVNRKEIPLSRIEESFERIQKVKNKYCSMCNN